MKTPSFNRAGLFSTLSRCFDREELVPKFMTYMDNHKKSCGLDRCDKIQTCKILLESYTDALSAHEPILLLATAIAMTAVANGQTGNLILKLQSIHNELTAKAIEEHSARKQARGGGDG